jgi:KDO2-lipid IV(A) lauroyltransferase
VSFDPRDAVVAIARSLPLPWLDRLAWLAAWTWWFLVPIRRRVAVDNLVTAVPGVAPRTVLVRMMHDLVLGLAELVHWDELEIRFEGFDDVDNVVLLGGHGAAWEIALCALAERTPVAIFLRTPSDPWTRAFLARVRASHGVQALETGSTMDDARRAMDGGASLIFVQDQRHARGIASPFFGRPAMTSAAFAVAALERGRAFAFWQYREGVGRHVLRAEPFEVAGDVQSVTDAANRYYEARIRESPHGWLWLHRRWAR